LISISDGRIHNLALKSDGTLWAWGDNSYGQLGDGTTTQRNSPVQVGNATDWISVIGGNDCSFALKSNGTLWAWGNNFYGKLGDGTTTERHNPVQIGGADNWVSVSSGNQHTVALKSDGTLWAWGYNGYGQLGDGTTVDKNMPIQIGVLNNWVSISCGGTHTLARKSDGTIWSWGYNGYGQLGDGTTANRLSPVQSGSGNNWVAVSCGSDHTLSLKADGTFWACGRNQFGAVGDGTNTDRTNLTQRTSVTDVIFTQGGGYHTGLIKADRIQICMTGYNGNGQLGNGTIADKNTFECIINASSLNTITCSPTAGIYCVGQNIAVPYAANGTFNAGNIFTAQLSNASGSFASPTNIGTLSSTTSGIINATVSATPSGNGYRIRVVSSNPAVTGGDNGSNITISNTPFISSFSPVSGTVGITVTINGCAFNSVAANNIVYFGSVKTTATSANATQLTVTVPPGAAYAPLTVVNTVAGLSAQSVLPFTPTFPCGGTINSSTFDQKVDFTVNSNLRRLAIADFDGDGLNDYALTASTSNIVTIYRNTSSLSSISFGAGYDKSAGSHAYDIAAADLNGDGKIDIVVTDLVDNTISVYKNNSTPNSLLFDNRLTFGTGSGPRRVVIADMNNDGKPDVVTANLSSNNISVLTNISSTSTINFTAKTDFSIGASPIGMAVGDLDGDGYADVVTSNTTSNNMSVLHHVNSSTISFDNITNYATGNYAENAAIGDLDGDGKNDVIIDNSGGNNFSVFRNTSVPGTITFDTKQDITTGSTPYWTDI
jgi:hypothetical protein